MPATSPAVEFFLRALRYAYRLPFLLWHVFVHLPVLLVLIAIGDDGRRPIGHAAIRLWARMLLRVFGMRVQGVGTPLPGGPCSWPTTSAGSTSSPCIRST
jgi:1-acyl-sn-glycerol-3-phosphate acyltransferase